MANDSKTVIDVNVPSRGTDFIRVDMFINGGQPVVNEIEIMSATPIPLPLQRNMADALNYGYSLHWNRAKNSIST